MFQTPCRCLCQIINYCGWQADNITRGYIIFLNKILLSFPPPKEERDKKITSKVFGICYWFYEELMKMSFFFPTWWLIAYTGCWKSIACGQSDCSFEDSVFNDFGVLFIDASADCEHLPHYAYFFLYWLQIHEHWL